MTHFIAFTQKGSALCMRLLESWEGACAGYAPERYCRGAVLPLREGVFEWARARFRTGHTLVFIGSAGIAVRAIAPYVHDKKTDPAVLCIDDGAGFVIPLLSGHIGRANVIAKTLAKYLQATPVITTATDVAGKFSPDAWASENGYAIVDSEPIRHLSAAILDGETVGVTSDYPIQTPLPTGLEIQQKTRCGMVLSLRPKSIYPHTLQLYPKSLVLGVGCRRNTPFEVLYCAMEQLLQNHGYLKQSIGSIATIELKANEPAVLALCETLRVPLQVFTAEELLQVPGTFSSSDFVRRVTGVDNVCERSAMRAGGKQLLIPKTTKHGTTLALAELDWRVLF